MMWGEKPQKSRQVLLPHPQARLKIQLNKPPAMVAGKKAKPRDKTNQSPPISLQFSQAAIKVAIAQICRSAGFKGCQPSALEALTRISAFYLQSLAQSAGANAASAGRTQSNLFDVVCAMEELTSPTGFPGASRHGRCLLNSGVLREIRRFVCTKVELPFAKPMPVRPRNHLSTGKLGFGDDRGGRMEIPPWLPEFPQVRDEGIKDQERSELHWEETRVQEEECAVRQRLLKDEDKRRKMLPLKRERVKFRVLGKEKGKRKEKVGFLLNWNAIDAMDKRMNGKT